MAAFKKNQNVFLIQSWNGKGEFQVVTAIVYSCGKKQMVLTDANTGRELGRNYLPTREQRARFDLVINDNEDARAIAMEQAAKFIAYEIARYERIVSNFEVSKPSEAYRTAILKALEEARNFIPSIKD